MVSEQFESLPRESQWSSYCVYEAMAGDTIPQKVDLTKKKVIPLKIMVSDFQQQIQNQMTILNQKVNELVIENAKTHSIIREEVRAILSKARPYISNPPKPGGSPQLETRSGGFTLNKEKIASDLSNDKTVITAAIVNSGEENKDERGEKYKEKDDENGRQSEPIQQVADLQPLPISPVIEPNQSISRLYNDFEPLLCFPPRSSVTDRILNVGSQLVTTENEETGNKAHFSYYPVAQIQSFYFKLAQLNLYSQFHCMPQIQIADHWRIGWSDNQRERPPPPPPPPPLVPPPLLPSPSTPPPPLSAVDGEAGLKAPANTINYWDQFVLLPVEKEKFLTEVESFHSGHLPRVQDEVRMQLWFMIRHASMLLLEGFDDLFDGMFSVGSETVARGRSRNAVSTGPVKFSFGDEYWRNQFRVFVRFSDGAIYNLRPSVIFESLYRGEFVAKIRIEVWRNLPKDDCNANLAILWAEAIFLELARQAAKKGNHPALKAHSYGLFGASVPLHETLHKVYHGREEGFELKIAECEEQVYNSLYKAVNKDSILVMTLNGGRIHDALANVELILIVYNQPHTSVDSPSRIIGVAMVCETHSDKPSNVYLGILKILESNLVSLVFYLQTKRDCSRYLTKFKDAEEQKGESESMMKSFTTSIDNDFPNSEAHEHEIWNAETLSFLIELLLEKARHEGQIIRALNTSTRAAKHSPRDIIWWVEEYRVAGFKQVEIEANLSKGSRKYGVENTCSSGSMQSRPTFNLSQGKLLKSFETQIAEPIRAIAKGASLDDTQHPTQCYDTKQEAKAQVFEISKRPSKVMNGRGTRELYTRLEADESKWQELKSNMAILGKKVASTVAAVEAQQKKMMLQKLISMIGAARAYHQQIIQILEGQNGAYFLKQMDSFFILVGVILPANNDRTPKDAYNSLWDFPLIGCAGNGIVIIHAGVKELNWQDLTSVATAWEEVAGKQQFLYFFYPP